jgi:hypothetical protein
MENLNNFITKQKIDNNIKLKYLITIPCVNREERNAINVITRTFESFEKSGLFNSNIHVDILLFESGSKNTDYLKFIEEYKLKYCYEGSYININILFSKIPLNGNSNTYRMFMYIASIKNIKYDFILWMDDDIYVCKNFIKNADIWIKNYANFSIFSSLYVPYNTFLVKDVNNIYFKNIHLANLPGFYGTCCTIFKQQLAKYALPFWWSKHFNKFEYNPDTRFRDSIKKYFPKASKICVSFPSFVEHMNIGSAIKNKKIVNIGHKAKFFIGEDNDPNL